jgi:hypothetical protein
MTRWWEITIDKWDSMDDENLVTVNARVQALNAQAAMRPFVDLTTQNGRVKRIEVKEIEGE